MVSWRSVTGKIELLDPQLTTAAQIQEFFDRERLLGRGGFQKNADGTPSHTFVFELAMGGRKRRVASLDEENEIILGHTTSEVLESLANDLRKVSVEIDGKTIHGPLDMGAVGIDEADLLVADLPAAAADLPESYELAENKETETQITGADAPQLAAGPTLLLGDYPLSELPRIANIEAAPLLNFKVGQLQAILLADSLKDGRPFFARPDLIIELSLGQHDFADPTLVVLRNARRSVWQWQGELPFFEWFQDSEIGKTFVRDELGAGAIARAAVADIIDVSFEEVRGALLDSPAAGARKLAQLFGVPATVLQFLAGEIDLATAHAQIPDSRIFAPGSRHETLRQTIAWEVAGEGVVDSDVAHVYRWMYLKRPWLVSLIAVAQAAIGGGILSAVFQREKKSKLLTVLGGLLVANAASRLITTEYVQEALADVHQGTPRQR